MKKILVMSKLTKTVMAGLYITYFCTILCSQQLLFACHHLKFSDFLNCETTSPENFKYYGKLD